MAHFLIRAMDGQPITLYGDGRQSRDVLFVDDLVEAKKQKIAALQLLKKSLMQNLLTGRIRLPVDVAAKETKP